MKRLLVPVLAVLIAALLPACGERKDEQKIRPAGTGTASARHPGDDDLGTVDGPTSTTTTTTSRDRVRTDSDTGIDHTATTSSSTSSTPPAAAQSGNYEYGKPVPGKPGYVTSPYMPNSGYVDVHGFPPGTEVRDPYSGKIFLVPAQ